jgi:FkbM family methyltransferase
MNKHQSKGEHNEYFTVPFQLEGQSIQHLRLLSCDYRDQVSTSVMKGGWKAYESPLPLLIAKASCKPKTIFLDIGANTGYYSLLSSFSGASEVHAFEPVPFIAEIVEANIQLNKPTRNPIILHRIAISDENKEAFIYMPDNRHGLIETSASLNRNFRQTHSGEFKVTCRTLDTHLKLHPLHDCRQLVIKIDVESLEPEVLSGSQATITNQRPLIFVEILPQSNHSFFYEWAYKNNYLHAILAPPNQINATRNIEGSLYFRDHLFYPEEKPLQDWL